MSTQYDRHTAAAGFSSRRRRLLAGGMAAGSALLLPGLGAGRAQAQGAASPGPKPVELVAPGGPGAGTDVVARVAANGLAEHLAHHVGVQNMPRADGHGGTDADA